jgi:hypothetical protein
MVSGIQLKQHIVEGDYVATVFDMETANGVDYVFDRIHIVDGQIQSIHAFYYSEQTAEGQIYSANSAVRELSHLRDQRLWGS